MIIVHDISKQFLTCGYDIHHLNVLVFGIFYGYYSFITVTTIESRDKKCHIPPLLF